MVALGAVVDEPLRVAGFSRAMRSVIYTRTHCAAEQEIRFAFDVAPSLSPGAEAHVHPMLRLGMSQVSETALSLVNGDRLLLAGAPSIIVNQPIEFTAPKDKHQRWFASGGDEFMVVCQQILRFINCWVLPLADEFSSPADLIRWYERGDHRVMKQQHWYVYVVAALRLEGRMDEACEVARKMFGRPGLRKRYSALFSSLGI